MSTTVSSGVWQCGPADQAQAFVLLAIADNADDFGFAFPSHETIAEKARCDKRTVIRHMEKLEEDGWLRVGRKMNGRGNVYFIDLEKIGVRVSPGARKSPLFMRLEKVASDKLSRIFLPKSSGDKRKSSGDNPQPPQVTKDESQVTPEDPQVTKPAFSGDTSSHSNPHEPPSVEPSEEPSGLEPSTDVQPNPLPPLQGVSGMSGIGSLANSLRRELAETTPEPSVGETLHSPEVKERFASLRRKLQEELSSVPESVARPRFQQIAPGENDFDACFRDWWLVAVRLDQPVPRSSRTAARPAIFTIATGSDNAEWTRKGFEKYGPRMQMRAREYFQLSPLTAVRFVVADTVANQQPAA